MKSENHKICFRKALHLIPRSRGGADTADNMVLSCRKCNTGRGDKGIFEWLGLKEKNNLHRLVAGKYLKELFELHEISGTLEIATDNIKLLCQKCKNTSACKEWGTLQELTCFCLESVF